MDRGLKWDEAYAKSLELTGPHDGFYLSYKVGVARPPTRPQGRGPSRVGRGGKGQGGEGSVPHPSASRTPAQVRGNRPSCLLAEQSRGKHFTVYKPNVGRQSQPETFDSLCRRFHWVGAAAGLGVPVAPGACAPSLQVP